MVLENQQTSLSIIAKIDGYEITEHGRKLSINSTLSGASVLLNAGKTKRYGKNNKKIFSFTWDFLPTTYLYTVDGREGRNLIKTLAKKRGTVTLLIKEKPGDDFEEYTCYVNSYSETLVRRNIAIREEYYNVTLELGEV